MDHLELFSTDDLLKELESRHKGIAFVGRPKGETEYDFRTFSGGGVLTDLIGMITILQHRLLRLDQKAEEEQEPE